MTYLQFLLIFIVPIVLVETYVFHRSSHPEKNSIFRGIVLLALLAVVYTTPWDNYLIMTHVWSYEDHRVLGKIGYVPLEEYAFFILQTFLSGFWVYFVQTKWPISDKPSNQFFLHRSCVVLLALLWFGSFYLLQNQTCRYLGLILIWSLPVLLLQWIVGGRYLLSNGRVFGACLLPVTAYLCLVDAVAIHLHVWKISMTQTVGVYFGPLPLEEAIFFLVTNLMLVQGLLLFVSMRKKYSWLSHRLFLQR